MAHMEGGRRNLGGQKWHFLQLPFGLMMIILVRGFHLGLHLCLSSGFMLFLYSCNWVYVILMFFPICLWYSYVLSGLRISLNGMEEERCDSHKGPGRSCGGKMCFPPLPPPPPPPEPLPLSLADGSDCRCADIQRWQKWARWRQHTEMQG